MGAMKNGPGKSTANGPVLPMRPTIVFHGDADETVHPRNGEQVAADAVAGLLAGGEHPPAHEMRGHSEGGRAFTRWTYADTRGGIAVEHWLLHGAGHAWAGGSADGSFTDPTGPDASAEMLRFFLSHPRLR
jgi:poly(3-hydroxybutyrate) depolymerase